MFGSIWLFYCLPSMVDFDGIFGRWRYFWTGRTFGSHLWVLLYLLFFLGTCWELTVNDLIINLIVQTCGSEIFREPTPTTRGSYFVVDAFRHFVSAQVKGTP